MDALILSCSTGGGHNAAGIAVKQELEVRGHHVVMMDPYELVSHGLAVKVANTYVKMAQRMPGVFGLVYSLGALVRHVPGKSPVYYANIAVAKKLKAYLAKHPVNVIIMPHLFPAELITYLKRSGEKLPLTVFIATDYVCIPFTEETDCDYYIVPGEAQIKSFVKRGIERNRILPFGIPVNAFFDERKDRNRERERLGLDQDTYYALLTGGSIGAGNIEQTIRFLLKWMDNKTDNGKLVVVCGNNDKLYKKLQQRYGEKLVLLHKTDQMASYMRACDVFISKPGGLSSTEAAVAGIPYIQIAPIPGCETKNMNYFAKNGMSIAVRHPQMKLAKALDQLNCKENADKMRAKQKTGIPAEARKHICDWLEMVLQGGCNV